MKTGLESLDTGASNITYSGNEGPKAPQQMAMADPFLIEEYQKYVFEMEEQGLQPMSFEEFEAQARAGMNEGGIAMQGGVKNYLPSQEVTVPKKAKSSKNHPVTELAYITEAEKNLLLKKDLHGSLNGKPNRGPGGIISLNGDFGIGESYGDRQTSDKSAEVGDRGGGYQEKGDPGYQATIDRIRANTIAANKDFDDKTIDDQKITLGDKFKKFTSTTRKKNLLKNIFHVAKGRPIQPALMALLQGKITEEEFQKDFGVSIDDLVGLSPMEQTNIFGDMSQFDKDRLGEMAEVYGKDYISQDDFTKAFYGPKGPPDLTGGGDGPQIYPYPYPMSTAVAPTAMAPENLGTEFTSQFTRNELTDADKERISGIGGKSIFLADGGRANYAGGGIADLRQGYFLGKLVKKATRGIKKIVKSPIGKAALLLGGGYLMNTGKFPGGFGEGFFSNMFSGDLAKSIKNKLLMEKIEGKYTDNFDPFKIGILGASALGGLYAKQQQDDEPSLEEYMGSASRGPGMDPRGIREYIAMNKGNISPIDYAFLNPDYYQTAADGGRIGLMNGGDLRAAALNELYGINNDEEDKKFSQGGSAGLPPITLGVEGQSSQSFPDDETPMPTQQDQMPRPNPMMAGRMNPMMGGRMNPMMGGRMNPMMGGRMRAQEGGLMDMGGMEKDYREEGGFVPIGGQERADDVPARLSKNEFVFTADAVRNAGGGDIDKGAEIMENMMENLEKGGKVSEDSQGLEGARDMFATAQRLEGVL